jgi:hypothetical protein
MLSLALASCGMSDSKRALAGINDASPVIGGGDGPRRILNDWRLKISQSADWRLKISQSMQQVKGLPPSTRPGTRKFSTY